MSPLRLASFLATLVIATTSAVAAPRTFTVDSFDDAPDLVADGTCSAAAPALGKCTLRAAIMEANRTTDRDIINLGAGMYSLTIPGTDDLARLGDLDILQPVTIAGVGATTIIDASALSPRDRVFHILAGPVTLQMLQIRGGDGQAFGAGIFDNNARLTLQNVTLRNNHATSDGGGLRATGANAIVTINDSTFDRNTAARGGGIALENSASMTMTFGNVDLNDAGSGGGVYLDGLATATISDSTFDGNTASDGAGIAVIASTLAITSSSIANGTALDEGGGIESIDATLSIGQGTTVSNNEAATGGGIYWESSTGTFVLLIGVSIDGNTASGPLGGGGMYARHGTVVFDGAKARGNHATAGPGGGLVLDPGTGSASLLHVTVSSNTAATDGGGIAYPTAGSVLSLERTTVDTNTATRDGGGIWAPALGTSSLVKSTISGNNASRGGGLWLKAATATTKLSILSTTVAYNTAPAGKVSGLYLGGIGVFDLGHTILSNNVNECGGAGAITSRGYNLFQSVTGCTATTKSTDVLGVSANLKALSAATGDPTRTHAPNSGSPVIDGGSPTAADCSAGGPTDQRDHAMPNGPRCDIGSYETP